MSVKSTNLKGAFPNVAENRDSKKSRYFPFSTISIKKIYSKEESYEKEFSLRKRIIGVVASALVMSVITTGILALTTNLTALPHDFIHIVTHLSTTELLISGGAVALLVSGTGWVIYDARRKKDSLIGCSIKSPSIFEVKTDKELSFPCQEKKAYLDTSTLDEKGTGKAYLYRYKSVDGHYAVSTTVCLTIPIYLIGTVVYHTIRMCIVPFYVLGCLLIEACRKEPLFKFNNQEKFDKRALVLEPGKSLLHVVTAPFYALAFWSLSIYSLIKPMEGRILAAKVERDWNCGNHYPKGDKLTYFCTKKRWVYLCQWKDLYSWAGLGPEKLGLFILFWAGCWQPCAVAYYQDKKIQKVFFLYDAVLENE